MKTNDKKYRVLFLCGTNSCRSQMSEGLVKNLWGDRFEVYSAGAKITEVHPLAIKVMKEIGIDISNQKSKLVTQFEDQAFDYVITLCAGDPGGVCPSFLGDAKEEIDWAFTDPALAKGSEEEVIKVFREVRDEIKKALEDLFKGL